jgi:hypothetical protein
MSENSDRKLTTADVIHIGLATKDPGAYAASALAVELFKLPIALVGAVVETVRESSTEKKRAAQEAEHRKIAEKLAIEEKTRRLEEAKHALVQREREKKRQEILSSMMVKPAVPEVSTELSQDAKLLLRTEASPGYMLDACLYAAELFQSEVGAEFLVKRGISPQALAEKLKELHNETKHPRDGSQSRLTPRVRMLVSRGLRHAADRFKQENPRQSGTAHASIQDMINGAIRTEGFVPELEPVWEHLRNQG